MACREHLAQLRERKDTLERLGAVVLAVTFEAPNEVAEFARREKLPFPLLIDPGRRAYQAFGLRRARLAKTLTWATARYYLKALLHGHLPRRTHGDVGQLGGDFVLDPEGRVVFARPSEGPADRPTPEEIIQAVEMASGSPRG